MRPYQYCFVFRDAAPCSCQTAFCSLRFFIRGFLSMSVGQTPSRDGGVKLESEHWMRQSTKGLRSWHSDLQRQKYRERKRIRAPPLSPPSRMAGVSDIEMFGLVIERIAIGPTAHCTEVCAGS